MLVSLEKVARDFGDGPLFADVSLRIEARERLGVIGDNGTGKTTLLRILAGLEEPDAGVRRARRGLRVAVGEQIPRLEAGATVLEHVVRGDGSFAALEQRIRALEARLAEDPEDARALREYGELQSAFEAGGGFERRSLCERVLGGLGFSEAEMDKETSVLSGGEKARVVLAVLMTTPADLLLLDEPTNHLDLEGIEFLEGFLDQYPGALVVVSHDRRFLDRVAKAIAEVEGGAVTRYRGNWSAYAEQRQRADLSALRAWKNQQERIAKEMDYIRRNMGGRMTRQAQGRLKRLQRLERLARPRSGERRMALRLGAGRGLEGQTILEAEDLAARAGERTLFSGASFRVAHGETLGIAGRNGAGKTTLLRILAGRAPAAAGEVRRAQGVRAGYFSQEMEELPSAGTVLEAMRAVDPTAEDQDHRDWLARFLFSGEDVDKEVGVLSGGERRRLCLARLLREPFDFLCLDEPTNHLDISARQALEEALADYPGAVLLVSHDRALLDALADRLLWVGEGRVRAFDGGLPQCLEWLARRRSEERAATARRRSRQESPGERARTDGRIRNPMMFERLEQRIIALEEEIEALQARMTEPEVYMDPAEMKRLHEREAELRVELASAYERWENWQ